MFSLQARQERAAKDPATYTIVGKSVPRLDIPDKATGRFTYMHDFRVAGMLHGRVVRPLAIGAKLESVDESSVSEMPGVVKVVRERNFLGVVATTEWGAIQAARELKATWSMGRAYRSGRNSGTTCAPPSRDKTKLRPTSAIVPRRSKRRRNARRDV